MGKAARFACIFLPMVATIMTAVLIVVGVMIGQTSKANGLISDMYFMRLDTRDLRVPDDIDLVPGTNLDDSISDRVGLDRDVRGAADDLGVKDWYTAGFWSYCSGSYDRDNRTKVEECSKPKAFFVFNIIDIVNAESDSNITFPNQVEKVFRTVNTVSRIGWILFMVGTIATGVEFMVGWFGLLSRWGSFCTTIVANIAFFGLFGGAIFNTVLYSLMTKSFNSTQSNFGVRARFNTRTYSVMWLAVAFSLAAAVFWLLSTCCCSGRRDRVVKNSTAASRGFGDKPSTYERVPSPYTAPLISGQAPEHPPPGSYQPYGPSSYEPMRHQQV